MSNKQRRFKGHGISPTRRVFPNSTSPSSPGLPSPTFWDRLEAEAEAADEKKRLGRARSSSNSGSVRTQMTREEWLEIQASVEDAEEEGSENSGEDEDEVGDDDEDDSDDEEFDLNKPFISIFY
jgi:hypothetical protein